MQVLKQMQTVQLNRSFIKRQQVNGTLVPENIVADRFEGAVTGAVQEQLVVLLTHDTDALSEGPK